MDEKDVKELAKAIAKELYENGIELTADYREVVMERNHALVELAELQARLAGYEVGYDPAERMPDDDEQVITFVNSKNWCFSNKDILSYLLKRHYLTDSTRWFPLPGSKEPK